jgi:hypothetical protein
MICSSPAAAKTRFRAHARSASWTSEALTDASAAVLSSTEERGQEPDALTDELDDALAAAHAGGFTGRYVDREKGTQLMFCGPNANRIGEGFDRSSRDRRLQGCAFSAPRSSGHA